MQCAVQINGALRLDKPQMSRTKLIKLTENSFSAVPASNCC